MPGIIWIALIGALAGAIARFLLPDRTAPLKPYETAVTWAPTARLR